MYDIIKCLSMKCETHFNLGNHVWQWNLVSLGKITKGNLSKKIWKMCPEHYFQALFNFQRILCKKESEEATMLIWTNFDSYVIEYVIEGWKN